MKQLLSVLILLSMLIMITGSCSSNRDGRHEAAGNSKSPSAEGQVTLQLLQFKVEITDKVKQMIADYESQHPNVKIEVTVTADYETLRKMRFATGDAPDLFMTKSYTDIADWKDYLLDLTNEPWMDQVVESAKPGMTIDGKMYGFPFAIEGYGFIYNKDLFKRAGIQEVPVTLSQLREVNEKLKAAGIQSYSEGYKEWWILGQHLFNLPFAMMDDAEKKIAQISDGSLKVNEIPYMQGFFDVLDMTLQYGDGNESIRNSYDTQLNHFAIGKSAMMQQGVWTVDSIMKVNSEMKMGMFAIPLSEDATETKLPVGVPGYYVIHKDSKHVEEARAFLVWLHENGQKYLVESFQFIPAFKDLTIPENLGPLASDMKRYVDANLTLPWSHALWPSEVNQAFFNPLQAYVGSHLEREQVLEEIQTIWDKSVSH